jgi:TOMM system kinase/cyclase fusion protein
MVWPRGEAVMTFEEVLNEAVALLQRQGRVAYRVLKRQFDLEDDYFEDLKEAILYAYPQVRDDGRGLLWSGDTSTAPASPSLQPTPHTASLSPDAERRQLTVLFCDLVDSTKLSSQLDPEEYRDIVRAYQNVCTEVIQRYEGHIAQLLGDGLLIYFGYPQAHEDDAQRAVRAGLGIIEAVGALNTRLEQDKGIGLVVRLGTHTGLVVVGEMGSQGRQEQLALGEVPNIGSRIEGLAAPNTIAVSEATYRLIQGYFECRDLGAQTLRGVAEPLHVYRVLQESGARGRLDVAVTRGLTPLVGRESEVTLLLERWEQVKDGQGQVVLLSGDAGIGKSRLVHMLKEHVVNQPHTCWECRSLSYFENTALFPLTDLFQRLLRFQAEETPDEKLGKLEQMLSQYRLSVEESLQLFAPLLSIPLPEHHYPPLNLSPQRQRQKMLETLVAILLELAEHQPVLFIVEDLHWTDPTTLELIGLLLDQIPTASLLMLLTCRPHFQPSWHHRSYLTEITVHRLPHTQVEQIVTGITDGKTFPAEVLQPIIARTDGVPLFVEEITKSLLESGQLKAVDGHYELIGAFSTFAIPATLQDSLMARLDRLISAKGIAQLGAAIGRQFAYDLLRAVSQWDESTLQRELGRLVEAELLYQRGLPPQATYLFKHALIQDAAYQSLLKSTRQHYHQRIAQVLEEQFPEVTATQPELLAHHYTEAGLGEEAVAYWQRAGRRALERSANVEAVTHLTKGLEVLKTLPDVPQRLQQELDLQTTLGPALSVAKGFAAPEVERSYTRACELCQLMGDAPQLGPVLWGLHRFYFMRGELQTAQALGEQLLGLTQHAPAPPLLLAAYTAMGAALFMRGHLRVAREHLLQELPLVEAPQRRALAFHYGYDPGVLRLAFAALDLWSLGYAEAAQQRGQAALTLAQELVHPFSLVVALGMTTMGQQCRRDIPGTQAQAEAALTLATEQGSPYWIAGGAMLRGWALAAQGQAEEGIAQIRQGLTAYRATGAELVRPYYLALLAEAYGQGGQAEAGLAVLAEALAAVEKTGERWCEAELYRLKGELLLQSGGQVRESGVSNPQSETAEICFHQALELARCQQAKSWELRAAVSLSRLWQRQGKRAEAHVLLAPIYGWFTEGLDTADLQEAKALLDELR